MQEEAQPSPTPSHNGSKLRASKKHKVKSGFRKLTKKVTGKKKHSRNGSRVETVHAVPKTQEKSEEKRTEEKSLGSTKSSRGSQKSTKKKSHTKNRAVKSFLHREKRKSAKKGPEYPQFGIDPTQLSIMHPEQPNGIPLVLQLCTDKIREKGIDEEGIFRVPGRKLQIEKAKDLVEAKQLDLVEGAIQEIYDWCGLLTLFLRTLPEPLLTVRLRPLFLDVINIREVGVRITKYKGLIARVPRANFKVLCHLMAFFTDIAAHSNKNKMDIGNLARVFQGSFFGQDSFEVVDTQCEVVRELIMHARDLFVDKKLRVMSTKFGRTETASKRAQTNRSLSIATISLNRRAFTKSNTISLAGSERYRAETERRNKLEFEEESEVSEMSSSRMQRRPRVTSLSYSRTPEEIAEVVAAATRNEKKAQTDTPVHPMEDEEEEETTAEDREKADKILTTEDKEEETEEEPTTIPEIEVSSHESEQLSTEAVWHTGKNENEKPAKRLEIGLRTSVPLVEAASGDTSPLSPRFQTGVVTPPLSEEETENLIQLLELSRDIETVPKPKRQPPTPRSRMALVASHRLNSDVIEEPPSSPGVEVSKETEEDIKGESNDANAKDNIVKEAKADSADNEHQIAVETSNTENAELEDREAESSEANQHEETQEGSEDIDPSEEPEETSVDTLEPEDSTEPVAVDSIEADKAIEHDVSKPTIVDNGRLESVQTTTEHITLGTSPVSEPSVPATEPESSIPMVSADEFAEVEKALNEALIREHTFNEQILTLEQQIYDLKQAEKAASAKAENAINEKEKLENALAKSNSNSTAPPTVLEKTKNTDNRYLMFVIVFCVGVAVSYMCNKLIV